jgi:outer membrane protein TolC
MHIALALAAALADAPIAVREPLSLETALARAHAQNPDLRALRERSIAAAARAEAIRKQRLPRLGVEVNAQRTDNPAAVFAHTMNAGRLAAEDLDIARLNAPGALSHLGSSLFVEMPIDLFGRVGLASDALAASQKAFADNVREAESTTALEVTEAYLGAVLARQATRATEKAVDLVRMSVGRTAWLVPLQQELVPVYNAALDQFGKRTDDQPVFTWSRIGKTVFSQIRTLEPETL